MKLQANYLFPGYDSKFCPEKTLVNQDFLLMASKINSDITPSTS